MDTWKLDARMIAGTAAVAASRSAETLFRTAGRKVLPASARNVVRRLALGAAGDVGRATPPQLHAVVDHVATAVAEGLPSARAGVAVSGRSALAHVTRSAASSAAREIGKGAARAGALGALVDGGVAAVRAVGKVRRGEMTARAARIHVAKEAFTGAAATAASVLAVSGVVALTGGLGAPLVFLLGVGAQVSARAVIARWVG